MPSNDPKSKHQRELLQAAQHLSEQSPKLKKWIASCGPCALEVAWERSLYESLVRAIAHQQLHGRAAATILGRLQAGFRGHDFPTPRQLARASTDKIRCMGFSAAKTVAIQGVADAAAKGTIPTREEAENLTNEEICARLVELRGVGQWTVEMLLIFTLGRLDVMPVDDFGVKTGLKLLLGMDELPTKKHFPELTDSWTPYRSVAAWYLWRRAEAGKPAPAAKKK